MYSLFFLICLFFPTSIHAQADWQLRKDKNGIQVYTRDTEASDFNDIRVELDLDGDMMMLREILLDIEDYENWVYGSGLAEVVEVVNPNQVVYYSIFKAPWPASDRDFYANLTIHVDTVLKSMDVESYVVKDYGPKRPDKVRIPRSTSQWIVTPISKGKIHLRYEVQLDPGGSIPSWIINLFSTSGPLSTFEGLKKKMREKSMNTSD